MEIDAEKILEDVKNEKPIFKKQSLNVKINRGHVNKLKEIENSERKKKELEKKKQEISEKNSKKVKKIRKKSDIIKKIKKGIDYKILKDIFIYGVFFGILLNFSLFCIFKIKFTWFSWLGWGLGLWIFENKIIPMIKGIFKK